jgi:hypothetical protein
MPSSLTPIINFDGDAYLDANPDVAANGGDALQHYIYYGRFEGRPLSSAESSQRKARLAQLPGGFDPKLYLEANPDVAAAGVDAVDHFVEFGRAEGRPLQP